MIDKQEKQETYDLIVFDTKLSNAVQMLANHLNRDQMLVLGNYRVSTKTIADWIRPTIDDLMGLV